MRAKKPPSLPTDAFDDPVPDPYPEFEDEVFEMYQSDGITPADIRGQASVLYQAWLDRKSASETDRKKAGSKD